MSNCSGCLITVFVPLERSGQFRCFVSNVLVHAPVLPVNSCTLGSETTCFLVYVIYYCIRHLCISLSENIFSPHVPLAVDI